MSFVSFLKQFGLDVLKGIQIFEGIEPVASAALSATSPKAASELDSISQMAGAAMNIESGFAAAFGPTNQTGPAKLAALVPQVQQIVLNSELLVGKKIGNEALFTKAMQEYAQATADMLNSLQPNVATKNPANAPPVPTGTTPVPPVAPATPPATPSAS